MVVAVLRDVLQPGERLVFALFDNLENFTVTGVRLSSDPCSTWHNEHEEVWTFWEVENAYLRRHRRGRSARA